jgi:integrase/recombinase XerD
MFRRMTRERYLSDAELERFMAAVRERRHVNQPRDHALFALLANTGMRPAEARALTAADLHLEGRAPWVRLNRPKKKHGPEQLRYLILQRAVATVVKRYADTLPTGSRLFPFTKRQSARLFHYYAGKAAIVPARKIYALRHTVGMRLWRHTKDVRLMQAILGHTNLTATSGYVHVSPEVIRDGYAAVAGMTP